MTVLHPAHMLTDATHVVAVAFRHLFMTSHVEPVEEGLSQPKHYPSRYNYLESAAMSRAAYKL